MRIAQTTHMRTAMGWVLWGALFGLVGCEETEKACRGGGEAAPVHFNLERDPAIVTNDLFEYRGPVTVVESSGATLVLSVSEGVKLVAAKATDAGVVERSASSTLPVFSSGSSLWVDLHWNAPLQPTWSWKIDMAVSLRAEQGGSLLLSEVWSSESGTPSEGLGLGVPISTTQVCTQRTSLDCVKDAEITFYSMNVQVDQPVSVVHGSSELFDLSGNSYRVWLEKAQSVRLISPFTCEDGGVDQGFRAVVMRSSEP